MGTSSPQVQSTGEDPGVGPIPTPEELVDNTEESSADTDSMTSEQYDNFIHDELQNIWILNLSMHFRESKREKFFVTYIESPSQRRRVTVSLDYRNAPVNSLEADLLPIKLQRDKSAKIYEAIRESLADIQFYDTVTNLKLQTTDGALHVHVAEDVNVRTLFSWPQPSLRKLISLGNYRLS